MIRTFLAAAAMGVAFGAAADEGHGKSRLQATDPSYQAECASCHVPYPPRLLPAASWSRLMATLDRHFGTDASLDAGTTARIGAFLETNAGRRAVPAGTLRITETAWFRHEHDEVRPDLWKRPSVKSAANCGACHGAADRGDFGERGLRYPQ